MPNPCKEREKMKNKKLDIKLTPKQISQIKKFLAKHKIMCDGRTNFGLICYPSTNDWLLKICLLSVNEWYKINKFFEKLGLYKSED